MFLFRLEPDLRCSLQEIFGVLGFLFFSLYPSSCIHLSLAFAGRENKGGKLGDEPEGRVGASSTQLHPQTLPGAEERVRLVLACAGKVLHALWSRSTGCPSYQEPQGENQNSWDGMSLAQSHPESEKKSQGRFSLGLFYRSGQ